MSFYHEKKFDYPIFFANRIKRNKISEEKKNMKFSQTNERQTDSLRTKRCNTGIWSVCLRFAPSPPGGPFHQTIFAKQKNCLRKSFGKKTCSSISPTIKTPNFKLKLAQFIAKFVCCLPNTVRLKSLSSFAREKAVRLMKSTPVAQNTPTPFTGHIGSYSRVRRKKDEREI